MILRDREKHHHVYSRLTNEENTKNLNFYRFPYRLVLYTKLKILFLFAIMSKVQDISNYEHYLKSVGAVQGK